MTPEEIEAFVDVAAATLGLDIAPAHRPGVLQYFALAASYYDLVSAHPVTIADDPAPVFIPVGPTEPAIPVSSGASDAQRGAK